jgi:hypothetical protein
VWRLHVLVDGLNAMQRATPVGKIGSHNRGAHAAAVPPRRVMNSRRLMRLPPARDRSRFRLVLCITAISAANGRDGSKGEIPG